MQSVKPMEVGVMFWAERDRLAEIKSLGVRCGQLGIRRRDGSDRNSRPGLGSGARASRQFTLVTVFAAYNGESYADIPTVQRTVGFIPRETRDERVARTKEVSDFAAVLGAPEHRLPYRLRAGRSSDPDYIAVREAVRDVCDHAAKHLQTFALETGQEPAEVLLRFFKDVNRPNLRINFDPANMILYGTGDPIEALKLLAPHVASVHCKDGDWPPKDVPGALGTERPLGEGQVGMERFVAHASRDRVPKSVEHRARGGESGRADSRHS